MLTKKQNLSPEPTETIDLTFSEMETFPSRTKGVKQRNLATLRVLQFHCYWRISTLEIRVAEINASLN